MLFSLLQKGTSLPNKPINESFNHICRGKGGRGAKCDPHCPPTHMYLHITNRRTSAWAQNHFPTVHPDEPYLIILFCCKNDLHSLFLSQKLSIWTFLITKKFAHTFFVAKTIYAFFCLWRAHSEFWKGQYTFVPCTLIFGKSWCNFFGKVDQKALFKARGPKSLNFPDGNFQRAKTFRTKCVNRFRDIKVCINCFCNKKVLKLFLQQKRVHQLYLDKKVCVNHFPG